MVTAPHAHAAHARDTCFKAITIAHLRTQATWCAGCIGGSCFLADAALGAVLDEGNAPEGARKTEDHHGQVAGWQEVCSAQTCVCVCACGIDGIG